jgi:hypothetical protein
MIRIFIVIVLCLFLNSCFLADATKGLSSLIAPSNNISGGDTAQNAVKVALNTGHGSSFDRSIFNKKDNSTQMPVDVSPTKTILAGVNNDKSKNSTQVQTSTSKNNKKTSYSGSDLQVINNNNESTIEILINHFASFIVSWSNYVKILLSIYFGWKAYKIVYKRAFRRGYEKGIKNEK